MYLVNIKFPSVFFESAIWVYGRSYGLCEC